MFPTSVLCYTVFSPLHALLNSQALYVHNQERYNYTKFQVKYDILAIRQS